MKGLWGNTYWPIYIIGATLTFLIPEIIALFTNSVNTLSDYAWRNLGFPSHGTRIPDTAAWFLTQGAFIVVALWLLLHIWYHQFE